MKKILNFLVLGLMIAVLVTTSGCTDKNAGANSTQKTYVVGTEPYFPPFEYAEENNSKNIVGFDVDLINAIAADQGFKVQWKDLEFDALIPALQSGQIDMIASGMTITEERENAVDFTEPYINAGLALAVAVSNEEIKGVDDLKGKVAAVQQGSTGSHEAEKLKAEGKIGDIIYLAHVNDIILNIQNERADFTINDLPVTQAFMSQNPGVIKIVDDELTSDSYGFAVKSGNTELLTMLNQGLENVKQDGTYDQIMTKYF
ncbi:periplasmic component of amino acid ABC-type transporter/signal transduction system [Methanomethylovorans hollandica DSM 15978]|uniref:Periplasmic component of amino acid ABC-type transporter/signal transduction system n=1 Tax=Methanomethylovorans hollandica (strain DSM 15978 / NBRC 107637 / DMS1) TaxID=867904 RepID=L0KX13_METHD|nr:basic amino acid ABC transporter substrate-binding protein [Methanomethylovorans hollandica]AGB49666.1 periplasmic component of amino acid ABC-type transporter/signal transduction system [Methanomethylovorans hollandica DSM 15978]